MWGACSGCDDTANGTEDSFRIPDVGSVYTMNVTHSVLGSTQPTQSRLDVTLRVADMIFEGKEHVAQFSADTMISLIAYEPNGDLSIYLRRQRLGPNMIEGGWVRLPFRGTDSLSVTLPSVPADTSAARTGNGFVRWAARPAGVERVVVQGKQIEARVVKAFLGVYSDSAAPVQSREYTIWYAPDLGYAVREIVVSLVHSREGDTERADTLGSSTRELTAYVLQ